MFVLQFTHKIILKTNINFISFISESACILSYRLASLAQFDAHPTGD